MDTPTLEFPTIEMVPAPAVAELQDITEIRNGTAIVKLDRTEAGLAQLRADLAGKTWDLRTTKGDKEARQARLRCVTLRSDLEKLRKAAKAPALEYGRKLDAEAARITAEILAVERPIDDQIVADERRRAEEKAEAERKERERVAAKQEALAGIRRYVELAAGLPSERIAKGISLLRTMTFPGDKWEEFAAQAAQVRDETLAKLETLHAQAVANEAQAAENERLRQLAAEQEAQLAALRAAQPVVEAPKPEPEPEPVVAAEPPAEVVPGTTYVQAEEPAMITLGSAPPVFQDKTVGVIPVDAAPRPVEHPVWGTRTTVTMGMINAQLGIMMTSAFIKDTLKIDPAGTEQKAVKFWVSDWPAIKAALVRHIEAA